MPMRVVLFPASRIASEHCTTTNPVELEEVTTVAPPMGMSKDDASVDV